MDDVTLGDFTRAILILLSILVGVGFAWRLVQARKWQDSEDKLLFIGVLFALAALAGRSAIAIQDRDPFVWPLGLFMISLGCFAAFLASPRRRR